MKLVKSLLAAAAVTLMVGVGAVSAQTTAPATAPATKPAVTAPAAPAVTAKKVDPAPAAKAAKVVKVKKPLSAESIACSAEADAKKLKGKERKKFRAACLKKAKAAKATKAPKKAA